MTAPTPRDEEREARETLVDVLDFAYQRGYHEHGYNTLDAYRLAVRRAYAAEIREKVEGMARIAWCDDDGGTGYDEHPDGQYLNRAAVLALLSTEGP